LAGDFVFGAFIHGVQLQKPIQVVSLKNIPRLRLAYDVCDALCASLNVTIESTPISTFFIMNKQITITATESIIGKPIRAPRMPIKLPIEESLSARECHASAISSGQLINKGVKRYFFGLFQNIKTQNKLLFDSQTFPNYNVVRGAPPCPV